MKLRNILISLIMILGALPLGLASESPQNVAVVVSTPADAIVAAPYAKAMGYKLIYTPTSRLSTGAERELTTGGYDKVIIVGGPVAVSTTVENQIKNLNIKTERVWGETRVETSIEVYKLIKKDKPELIDNIVITNGFNEKVSPVAVSFKAPVLYYGLNKDEKVMEILRDIKPKNAVVLGKNVPKGIVNTASKNSESTFIASGSEDDVVRTAISYVEKINPDAKNKGASVVYTEKTKDPILNAIVNFVEGYTGMIVSLSSTDKGVLNKILSKVIEITTTISVNSDNPTISEKIKNIAQNLGPVSVSLTSTSGWSGGGGSGGWSGGGSRPPSTPTPTGPAVKIVADGKTIVFEGQDKNTLKITGNYTIDIPKIKAVVNVVDKEDDTHNITIDFRDNKSVASIVEAMNNFNVVAYNGSNVKITYNNPDMKGKDVSLHVITTRKTFRNNVNSLLDGDATGLIKTLNESHENIGTVLDNGEVVFTYNPSDCGEHIVIITEGNGVPIDANNVRVLAVGGFEVVKYNMSIEYETDSDTVNVAIELNSIPDHKIRYGAVLIDKDVEIILNITGTNPNNNLFNVSIVREGKESQIVANNDFIKLNRSKVSEIIGTIYDDDAASDYTETPTKNASENLVLMYIENSYLVAIAYDTVDKKIVAIQSQKINN
ncbi:cell wall-binding repeat-containing protein [Methanothermococcus sp. SCGC AD-155-C09]|nr:cell wall-binding repeat-containing protein [Methanothermococcus sp. SCGC AD-155-C09]